MPQAVTIRSLPRAFELVKAMQAQGLEWGEGYRGLGREAIAAILQGQMAQAVDEHLDRMALLDQADRRNGCYRRHLLTELGDIELAVPRTRRFAPIAVARAYARRPEQIDRMILACFVLGLSVRKVGEALLPILGRPISPTTVSTVAKQLDAVVAAFHARLLKEHHRVLMLDGVVLACKTGAGAIRRPVLVALGLRCDGKKEVIDFRLAASESAAEWERFLGDLIRRGLIADQLEMICVDGGAGLLAALPTACPGVPMQRCWAHKIRNVLNKVRVTDQPAVKADLHAVMNAARCRGRGRQPVALPTAGPRIIPGRSPAYVTISTSCSRAGATNPSASAKPFAPPMPSSGAFAKSDGEPGQWVCSPTEPRWIASSSLSSTTKTKTRASAPLSC
jgi:putative transposase